MGMRSMAPWHQVSWTWDYRSSHLTIAEKELCACAPAVVAIMRCLTFVEASYNMQYKHAVYIMQYISTRMPPTTSHVPSFLRRYLRQTRSSPGASSWTSTRTGDLQPGGLSSALQPGRRTSQRLPCSVFNPFPVSEQPFGPQTCKSAIRNMPRSSRSGTGRMQRRHE